MVWLSFAICVAIIAIAGRNVAKYGDAIADKTGLGGVWIGATLVSITTSLPEIFTGISSVVWANAPDLSIGDLFGANNINILKLAVLDIFYPNRCLLAAAGRGQVLTAGASLIMVALAASSLSLSGQFPLGIGWIGIYTPIIFFVYIAMVRMLFQFEKQERVDILGADSGMSYGHITLRKAVVIFAISAAFIIGGGIWLAFIGKEIADVTGWGQSFVGSLFLAFTTTLPEVTVGIAALRIGAVDIIVGDTFGSNLFNMLVIGVDDIFYTPGPVLAAVSPSHIFTAMVVMLLTGLSIAALISPPMLKRVGYNWYIVAVIAIFLVATYISFTLGQA
ncbi:MAG: sodium:calcium antiporter [Dehalococcoidia bacterium]